MKIALLTAAIVSSAYGTSCLADEINRTPGSPGFLTASLTQATNGAPAGSISTKGIVGTISTGEDNCNIYISGLKFDITTKNNSDPKM